MTVVAKHAPLRPWLVALTVLSTAVVYYLLHISYIPSNSDDAWTTSFAYNFFYRHELQDTVFGRPAGTLIAFGYSYAALQKIVLDAFGWTRSNAILLSTCLFFLSLPFWWRISRGFGCSESVSFLYVLLLPLWEPLFRVANTARPDACCLLLVGVALFQAQKRNYILAGIASGIALEVHQMGALAFVLVGIHVFFDCVEKYKTRKRFSSLLIMWAAGILLGTAYYLFLHLAYLQETMRSINRMQDWSGNFIWSHFFMTKSYRHVPVLLLFVISFIAAFKMSLIKQFPELCTIVAAIILFSMVFPRSNVYYSAYFFVFAILIVAIVVSKYMLDSVFVLLFLCFVLPQYGYIYYTNRNFDMSAQTAALRREVPESCSTLVGPFNAWFAFKERRFLGNISEMVPEVSELFESRSICYVRRLDAADSRDVMRTYFATGPAMKTIEAGGHCYGLYLLYSKVY